ncbi:hypothetical protein AYI68_g2528 [Smittium mucronatum]|uniref:FAS1 domain-containing protein n=1 Tax=Smittium mucronatum TaxID=133383 RepID=A0A1R0H2I4_9FUNG|nr:hypothetical protein AYI68_g2528 [Smittium mucronatum]
MKFLTTNSLLAVAFSISSCMAQNNTIIDVMKKDSSISIITKILERMFKTATFDPNSSPYTLFAPTDKAIRSSSLGKLPDDEILSILAYHVLSEKVLSKDIKNEIQFYPTMQQERKYVNLPGGKPQVLGLARSGSKVVVRDGIFDPSESPVSVSKADVLAAKGVIHVIDKVLKLPQKVSTILESSPRFALLGKELNDTNLISSIDNTPGITLFAPSNSALRNLLDSNIDPSPANLIPVLENHVINGEVLYSSNITNGKSYNTMLNGSKVRASRSSIGSISIQSGPIFAPNLLTENGVIQGINFVLTPDKSIYTPSNKTSDLSNPINNILNGTSNGINNGTTNGTLAGSSNNTISLKPNGTNRPLFNLILNILGITSQNSGDTEEIIQLVTNETQQSVLSASQNVIVSFENSESSPSNISQESPSSSEISSETSLSQLSSELISSELSSSESSSSELSSSELSSSESISSESSSSELSSSEPSPISSAPGISEQSSSALIPSESSSISSLTSSETPSVTTVTETSILFSTESFIITSTIQLTTVVTETSVINPTSTSTFISSTTSTSLETLTVFETIARGPTFTSTLSGSESIPSESSSASESLPLSSESSSSIESSASVSSSISSELSSTSSGSASI